MDLSVVIVTWNARDLTRECLSSLLHQAATVSMEIIVVDNASSDGTAELIGNRFPGVRLVQNRKNEGFAKANNVGIRLSAGKYVCLINSDVSVPPDCLAKLYEYMECEPSIGMLGPKMLGPDGNVRRSCMRFPSLWNNFCRALGLDAIFTSSRALGSLLMNDFNHDCTREVDILNGWFWVVRRDALMDVGLLDEQFFIYGEDVDWCYRFHEKGWGVVFYPEASATHYGGASSANAPTRFYVEMHKANRQYWAKYHGRLSQAAYLLTILAHELVRVVGYAAQYLIQKSYRTDAIFKVRRSLACLLWMTGIRSLDESCAK